MNNPIKIFNEIFDAYFKYIIRKTKCSKIPKRSVYN